MVDKNSLIERFVVMGIDATKESTYHAFSFIYLLIIIKLAFNYASVIEGQVHPSFLDIYPFDQHESASYLDSFKLVITFAYQYHPAV